MERISRDIIGEGMKVMMVKYVQFRVSSFCSEVERQYPKWENTVLLSVSQFIFFDVTSRRDSFNVSGAASSPSDLPR